MYILRTYVTEERPVPFNDQLATPRRFTGGPSPLFDRVCPNLGEKKDITHYNAPFI